MLSGLSRKKLLHMCHLYRASKPCHRKKHRCQGPRQEELQLAPAIALNIAANDRINTTTNHHIPRSVRIQNIQETQSYSNSLDAGISHF